MPGIEVHYRNLRDYCNVGSIIFDDEQSPTKAVVFLGFPQNMAVGDEVVIPTIGLTKGDSILVHFHSSALEVQGSCRIGEGRFVFPKRDEDSTWYFKFIAKSPGRVRPYVTFQRLRRSKLRVFGLVGAVVAALTGSATTVIAALESLGSLSGGISLAGGLAVLAAVPAAWTKLEPLTKQWESARASLKTPEGADAWVKMFPEDDLIIERG